eukprot:2508403-Rhodomonas_salina.2
MHLFSRAPASAQLFLAPQVYNNTETMQGFGSRFIGQALIPVASLLPRLESSRVTDSVRVGNVGVGVEGEPVPTRSALPLDRERERETVPQTRTWTTEVQTSHAIQQSK